MAGKIILFYKYIDIANPQEILQWQVSLCKALNLKGRVIIAHEGINGTVGGSSQAIDLYKQKMSLHELFAGIEFKEGIGGSDFFPRMRVVVRNEIVNLGIHPDQVSAKDAGAHLTPEQTHQLIASKPDNLLLFDARNDYESRIGTFVNAITPNIQYFRELPQFIDSNEELFKDKQVVMFCTGGIRCERASAYLKLKNIAKEVYQMQGGIDRYVAQYPNGYFRGKNYVFDGRISVPVTNEILTHCDICNSPYDEYTNCLNAECNKQYVACPTCMSRLNNCCSQRCLELVTEHKVVIRKIPKKMSEYNTSCNR